MLNSFAKLFVFIFSIVVTLEICLRFFHYGTDAFSPEKINSYTLIMNTDLVQPADNPDIYFELRPNLESLFRGKRFTTNSNGLADKEYAREKPADVYRIAVAGSSWTMATGVETDKSYHSLLENQLQEYSFGKFEILNFGVEFYGLGEIIATVRNKALTYDPDMVILAITATTPTILWEEHKEPFTSTEQTPPFLQSDLLSTALNLFGKSVYKNRRRPMIDPTRGAYMRQVKRSVEEFSTLMTKNNIDGVVIWLTYDGVNDTALAVIKQYTKANGLRFIPINLKTEARDKRITTDLIVRDDAHPNQTGHRLIAEKLYTELWKGTQSAPQP